MRKKWLLIIIPVMVVTLLLSAVISAADNTFLKPAAKAIYADETLGFTVDLSNFDQSEYPNLEMVLTVTPTDPRVSLDCDEDIDMLVNSAYGTYKITNEYLNNEDDLHFVLSPPSDIAEKTTYTVQCQLTSTIPGEEPGEGEEDPSTQTEEESFDFTVKPLNEDDEDDGGGGDGEDTDKYLGSADNYLKSLSVGGYEFEQTFHKTRDVYFVNVPDGVSSLSVHAVPCDKGARVDIAGNHDVSMDMSKIIIDVTAKNGDLREYRIYVQHDTEDE